MGNHTSNLTPAQAAALLGVSGSTLRRWSVDYGDRLSDAARPGPGRKRSYTPDDIAQLERVRDLFKAGKTPEEVGALLGMAPDAMTPTGAALVTLPSLIERQAQALQVIDRLQALAQAQAAEVDRLCADYDRQAAALANMERAQAEQAQAQAATQADLDRLRAEMNALQRRGFWARLFNRAPWGTF